MITAELARESITVSTTAIGFTTTNIPPTSDKCQYARVQVTAAQIRVRLDGTDPVAATSPGELWNIGDIKEVWGGNDMREFKAIREGSTDAVLNVSYHGGK